MAIALKKLAAASKASTAVTETPKIVADNQNELIILSDFSDKIDRLGQLQADAEAVQKQIKALTEKLKPMKDAEAVLQLELDALEVGDDDKGEQIGESYRVEYGAKGSSRELTDMEKVREFLGDTTFFELAKLTLKDVDAYLTPPQKEQVITVNRTKRSFKLIKRVA